MDKVIGYTTGVYDLFHIGHLNVLKRAKNNCDYLIVGVTTDELSETKKGKRPIIPYEERAEILQALKFVDMVVPQKNYDKNEAWQNYHFNKMFVGDDWLGTDKWNQIEKKFKDLGVEIVYFPYTKHTSSTLMRSILEKI